MKWHEGENVLKPHIFIVFDLRLKLAGTRPAQFFYIKINYRGDCAER